MGGGCEGPFGPHELKCRLHVVESICRCATHMKPGWWWLLSSQTRSSAGSHLVCRSIRDEVLPCITYFQCRKERSLRHAQDVYWLEWGLGSPSLCPKVNLELLRPANYYQLLSTSSYRTAIAFEFMCILTGEGPGVALFLMKVNGICSFSVLPTLLLFSVPTESPRHYILNKHIGWRREPV